MATTSYNSAMKAGLSSHSYLSLQWSDYSVVKEADQFYERIKEKPTNVLERYSSFVEPKGFVDSVKFLFDGQRKARFASTGRVLKERKIASHLEQKLHE